MWYGGGGVKISEESMLPIYIQIADAIENDILSGALKEGENCYSQVMIAKELKVNPATAAKGINMLVSREILMKQRGQAMIIAEDAREKIIERKKKKELSQAAEAFITIAKKLGLDKETIIHIIHETY